MILLLPVAGVRSWRQTLPRGVVRILDKVTDRSVFLDHSPEWGILQTVREDPSTRDDPNEPSQTLRRRVQALEALQAAVLEIAVLQDPTSLLETILDQAMRLVDAPEGALYLYEPDQRRARCVVGCGTHGDRDSAVFPPYAYGEGMVSLVAETGEPLLSAGSQSVESWTKMSASEHRLGAEVGTALAVPMSRQKHVLGVIWLKAAGEAKPFGQADLELLAEFACHAAMAIENAALYARSDTRLQAQTRRLEALIPVSYTHLTLPTINGEWRARGWAWG